MFGRVELYTDPYTGCKELQPVTLSGPAEGVVNKVAYCCNLDYNMVLENGGVGGGYVGLSTCCPITYNPYCCVGDDENGCPIHKGVLVVDCIIADDIEGAGCAEQVYKNYFDTNTNYSIPLWNNAAPLDKFIELGESAAYPLYFNPVTGTVTTRCYKAGTTLVEETGVTFNCSNRFSITGDCATLTVTNTCITANVSGTVGVLINCSGLSVTTPRVTMDIDDDGNNPDITTRYVCYYLDSKIDTPEMGCLCLTCMCFMCGGTYTKAGMMGYSCGYCNTYVQARCDELCFRAKCSDVEMCCCCTILRSGCGIYCFGESVQMTYNGPSCTYKWCVCDGMFYKRDPNNPWRKYSPGAAYCVCGNTLIFTV